MAKEAFNRNISLLTNKQTLNTGSNWWYVILWVLPSMIHTPGQWEHWSKLICRAWKCLAGGQGGDKIFKENTLIKCSWTIKREEDASKLPSSY